MHPWIIGMIAREHRRHLLEVADRSRLARSVRRQRGAWLARIHARARSIAGEPTRRTLSEPPGGHRPAPQRGVWDSR